MDRHAVAESTAEAGAIADAIFWPPIVPSPTTVSQQLCQTRDLDLCEASLLFQIDTRRLDTGYYDRLARLLRPKDRPTEISR
ncbi:hypothetical protein U8Q06_24320 (plasmid) [Rhizobium beringeri]|jgi:hypothetical protein|nr:MULTISPECIES: hypothetical protein [Rhizobium]WSH53683.1 hypothetical protein U8Q06_24320 [Rhizobium beringeri]